MTFKPAKIYIGLGIVVLALVLIGIEIFIRPKVKTVQRPVNNYQECVDAGGAILESNPSQCSLNDQSFTNPIEKVAESVDQPSGSQESVLKDYTDTKYGFKLKYDSNIFTEGQVQEKFPWKNKSVSSFQIAHTLPVEHCDSAGKNCVPTTTDISVAFVPVEASLNEILAVSKNLFGPMEKWDFHGIPATVGSLNAGVPGETKQYVFISLSTNRTLMIVRTHIDEQILTQYQNVEGFLGRDKQEMVFDELMKTFELTK